MLRTPKAWSVDMADLDAAERCGAHTLELRETEQNHVYRVSLADLRAQGFTLDRGHGAQIALPLAAWTVDGQAPETPKPQPAQLGLALAAAPDVDAPFVECWALTSGKPGFERLWLRFTADGPCLAWPECLAALRRGYDTLFILGAAGGADGGAYLPITALAEGRALTGRDESVWFLRCLPWALWRVSPASGAPTLDGETLAVLQRVAREVGRSLERSAL